jgi:hypothetical protein
MIGDMYKIDADGVHYPSREAVQERIAKSIAMDFDGKVHAALERMGWTPPRTHPESAAGMHGMAVASLAARIINALQAADWINPDVDNEDLSDACRIIADEIAKKDA